MKRLLAAVLLVCAAGCASVPVSGRRQMVLMSAAEEKEMGRKAYSDLLKKETLSDNTEKVALVRRIGDRLAKAADKPDFEWEFNLIRNDKLVNAFCLPGGKVAVYTGLLPVAENDDGLAVVMGHEIAHALARHGAERMSQAKMAQIGGTLLSIIVGGKDPGTRSLYEKAYGMGVGLGVMLPFSRKHESEADYIGLILMAKAGYDPRAALSFWKRMEQSKGGKGSPIEKYLSTHPTDVKRQDNIRGWLPEALQNDKPKAAKQ